MLRLRLRPAASVRTTRLASPRTATSAVPPTALRLLPRALSLRSSSTAAAAPVASPAASPGASPRPLPAVGAPLAGGWLVSAVEALPALGVTAITARHATGAAAVHLACADAHAYFSVSFRTPVDDDSGVPHVLEHTALCGSERFDVKDPFHAMARGRSMQTDMNAATGPALTSYYFSTVNAADWRNLLAVYLDAAFFPRLREEDFRQEGARLEPRDAADAASALALRGVVYNEMKGYASGAGEHTARALAAALLPGTPYACAHGGDPRALPALSHATLLAFHAAHYAPANALFVTYGDVDLDATLGAISEAVLNHPRFAGAGAGAGAGSSASDSDSERAGAGSSAGADTTLAAGPSRTSRGLRVPLTTAAGPAPGPAIRRVRVPPDGYSLALAEEEEGLDREGQGALGAGGEPGAGDGADEGGGGGGGDGGPPPNCTFTRAWAVGDARDPARNLLMRVMTDVLTYGFDSPLYAFIVRAGLAATVSSSSGFDASSLQPVLTLGGAGVREADAERVDAAIDEALAFACDPVAWRAGRGAGAGVLPDGGPPPGDPFAPARIRAVLHSLEVALRTRTPAFGASLAAIVADHWSLGVPPDGGALVAPLRVDELLPTLRLELGISEAGEFEPAPAPARPDETRAGAALRAALRAATLDNRHTVRLLAVPDATLVAEAAEAEAATLAAAEAAWGPAQRAAALASSAAAEARRAAAPAAAACLPRLPVSAVPRASPVVESVSWRLLEPPVHGSNASVAAGASVRLAPAPVPLQIVEEATNGLATLRLVFPIALPPPSATGDDDNDAARRHHAEWAALQAASPLSRAMLRLPDELHAWLPLAAGFTAYGTESRPPPAWETDARAAFGRLSASIVTGTPTLLPAVAAAGGPGGGASNVSPAAAALLRLPPGADARARVRLAPPLYGLALDFSWIADEAHTDRAVTLVTDLLSSSAAATGALKSRDRALFSAALRAAAVETAMAASEAVDAYARRWAAARLHPLSRVAEAHGGLTQARLLAAIAAAGDAGVDAAADATRAIVRAALARPFVDRLAAAAAVGGPDGGGLDGVAAAAFPLRAMLTCEGGRGATVSVGGAGGRRSRYAPRDMLTGAVEFMLGALRLSPPAAADDAAAGAIKSAGGGAGAGGGPLRAPPLVPLSLRGVPPARALAPAAPGGLPARTLLRAPGAAVGCLALALPGPAWGHPEHAALAIACSALTTGRLHEAVRERGGAYDVAARLGNADDVLITTAEDPTPGRSLRAAIDAAREVAGGAAPPAAVDEARLAVLGELDAPVGPDGRGLAAFMYGVTPAARQAYRDAVFDATPEAVAAAAARWLAEPLEGGRYSVVVGGPPGATREELGGAADAAPAGWTEMDVLQS